MIDERERYERAFELFEMPGPAFERLARRRERRRRNRRVAAGVVGLALAALVFGGLLRAVTLDHRTPAEETPTPVPRGSVRFESPLYGYTIEIPGDWEVYAANFEWGWGESLNEGSTELYRRDDYLSGPETAVSVAAMAIPRDMSEAEWLDRMETLAAEWCTEPAFVEPLDVDGVTGRLVEDCDGGRTLLFASAGRGYRVFGSEESLRWVASSIELAADPPNDPPASADAWRGIWPQTTQEEAEAAQAAANAGDPAYTWQIPVDPAEGEGDAVGAPIATRFLEEQLGWDSYWMTRGGGSDAVWELLFIRCEPGLANLAYPDFGCAPTDGNRFPTVLVRIERLIDSGRGGIWIVTRSEELPPFEQAVPPTEQEIRDLIARFAEARIAGEGAESYLLEDWGQVQLLHATTAGEPYEGFEIVEMTQPRWPDGEVLVTLRMIASGGDVVVEQRLAVIQRGPSYPSLADGLWIEGRLDATENGEPVDHRYGILGGRVTFGARRPWMSPWFGGVVEGEESILSKGDEGTLGGRTAYFVVLADPWLPQWSSCAGSPASPEELGSPASAEELVRGIVESSELAASAPEVVTLGGVAALRLDVTPTTDARLCPGFPERGVPVVIATHSGAGDAHPFAVKPDERMRIYLLELPGEPAETLAIAIIATTDAFDRVVEAAAPIVDSIRFEGETG